jgi:hypothetical protein
MLDWFVLVSPMDATMHATPYTHLNNGIDLYDGNLMHAAHGKEALPNSLKSYRQYEISAVMKFGWLP